MQCLLLSNEHFEEERQRLLTRNGLLVGPCCGACGKAYLDAPDEFAFDGANGRMKSASDTVATKPRGVRLIHTPCRSKKGARFTASQDHVRQAARETTSRSWRRS